MDLRAILPSKVSQEKALDRYLKLLEQETNFTNYNFDYILKNFKKSELFNRKTYKEITRHQHDFILSLIWQLIPTLPLFIANYVCNSESETDNNNQFADYTDQALRRLLPKPEFKNTFPFDNMRPVQSGIFERLDHYLNNPDITDIIIDAPTGCVDGDTIIRINRAMDDYSTTIKKEWQRQVGLPNPETGKEQRNLNTNVRGLTDANTLGSICSGGIVHSGFKECIRLTSSLGRSIVLTPEHLIYSNEEWIESRNMLNKVWHVDSHETFKSDYKSYNDDPYNLKSLTIDERLKHHSRKAYSNLSLGSLVDETVVKIENVGMREVFDVIDTPSESFTANDIVIHNSGKSGIAIAALLRNRSGYLITANKALQDQYISEFNWLSDLRGRSNYRCQTYEGFDCRGAPCQRSKSGRNECREAGSCDYGEAKQRALQDSNYSLLNMHTLISYAIYAPKIIFDRQILIIDEAHSFPEVISSSVGLSLRLKSLTPYKINFIPEYQNPARYKDWLSSVLETIKEDDSLLDEDDAQLVEKLGYILSQLDSGNLALDYERDMHDVTMITVLKLHPIRVEQYYNNIKRLAPVRIHLSATILGHETYCNMLGIESHNVAILRAGSPFPAQIRPIYLSHAVGQINMKTLPSLMPSLIKRVEDLMDHYGDYRGIIHGTTYNICNQIYSGIRSDLRGRLLYARSSKEQGECLQRHRESKNTLLLSPSMTEGVDLKGSLSRLQIMVKIPYPYLGDPLIQKRKEIYFGYYEMLTATAIMQAYGRSVRSDDDWCHTFVLDSSFIWFIKSNPKLFPQWFLDGIVWN